MTVTYDVEQVVTDGENVTGWTRVRNCKTYRAANRCRYDTLMPSTRRIVEVRKDGSRWHAEGPLKGTSAT